MNTLIFQIDIKQWDKSQRTDEHVAARAVLASCHPIKAKPQFFILNKDCIIDQHTNTHSASNRELETKLMKDGSVMLERFLINEDDGKVMLSYQVNNSERISIGNLNHGWIQAKYTWRKSVQQNDQIFWLYEEITLNAVCLESFEADYFLSQPPKLVFNSEYKAE